MAELIELKEIEERVILVAVSTGDEKDAKASLDELEELLTTELTASWREAGCSLGYSGKSYWLSLVDNM